MTASTQNQGTGQDGADAPAETLDPGGALPSLDSKLGSEEVLAALESAARRGKLPGFSSGPEGRAFRVVDFGKPFESRLIGEIGGAARRDEGACRISFTVQMKPVMPLIFGVLLIASVWPGILLTDSMLKMYFSWYTIPTWWWYLPLTVPFVPLAFLKAWRLSKSSGRAEALEIIQGISEAIGGGTKGR